MQRQDSSSTPFHAHHDTTLIAGHAAGDLSVSEALRAATLIASCDSCRELERDLLAIAAATHDLPRLATAPRDFRLDAAQAARLRRGSWIRTVLSPFSGARSAARPVAFGFTSFGLAGLFLAVLLPGLVGSSASLSAPERQSTGAGGAIPSAAAELPITAVGGPVPAATSGDNAFGSSKDGAESTDAPEAIRPAAHATAEPRDLAGQTAVPALRPVSDLLLIGSLALVAIGAALFALRFLGRRLDA